MPVHVTYPGVYIEEVPSSARTVVGISTSTAAFVDYFSRGPMSGPDGLEQAQAKQIFSYREFTRTFGGLDPRSESSYGIMQFFNNGGQTAFIVRVDDGSGREAVAKFEVKVPYIRNFASDARDAANQAVRAAARAGKMMDAVETVLAALGARQDQLPKLAPGVAASREAEALEKAKAAKTRDELGQRTSQIEDVVGAAEAAIEAAGKAGADTGEAEGAVMEARVAYEAIDTRQSAEDLVEPVETASAKAVAAAKAAAAAAKDSDAKAYQEYTGAAVLEVVERAERANDALRAILWGAGWSGADAAASLDGLSAPFEEADGMPVDKDGKPFNLVKRLRGVHDAAAAAIDRVHRLNADKPKDDQINTNDAVAALRTAQADAKQLAEGDEQVNAAIASAQAAAKAAGDLVAGTGEEPEEIVGELKKQIAEADQAAAQARAAQKEIGDPPDPDKATIAIEAANESVDKTDAAGQKALVLIPDKPDIDESGWPPIALVAERAADLTSEAAERTREAADATEAASKVLATRLRQWEAAHGAIAEKAQKASDRAAEEAGTASAKAEGAANEARKAAEKVRIGKDGEELKDDKAIVDAARQTILDTATAAEEAAAAADAAADAAMDAHLAALEAGEAGEPPNVKIAAISPGEWGNSLRATITNRPGYRFDLEIVEEARRNGKKVVVNRESYSGLSVQSEEATNYAPKVVNDQSQLARASYSGPAVPGALPANDVSGLPRELIGGVDGNPPGAARLTATMRNALDNIAPSIFNILCLPITSTYPAAEASSAITNALDYCERRRAFMIVDVPESVRTVDGMKLWMGRYGNAKNYVGAVYFPRLKMPDPADGYRMRNVAPSGTMAGVYARTDSTRGLWKAPAGTSAVLAGAEVVTGLSDDQTGLLNPLGVNVLRAFPVYGNVAWGARTLAGADAIGSEWKYLSVRRLVSYIEESLFQSLKWAVFEPNEEKLWGTIRSQVGSFLGGLYAQGAFAGSSPDKAFFVHCDASTTTQNDIDRGIVNIVVGVAPVKPAEFIILHIEQIAGQD